MSMSDKDYQKLAQAIVSDYKCSKVPLRDNLIKVADAHDLNVNETKRLLEATNVHAHLTFFKEASSEEKYVEFDVIDPDDVCGELFGRVDTEPCTDTRPGEKIASYKDVDHYIALPDEHKKEIYPLVEKVAQESVPELEEHVSSPYEGKKGYAAYSRVNKVASELKNKAIELHQTYYEEIEKLSHDFKSIYGEDFETFEKDAQALYGEEADHVIDRLAGYLGKETNNVKTANYYVIDKPVHEKLASAIDTYKDLRDHLHAYEWYKGKADQLIR